MYACTFRLDQAETGIRDEPLEDAQQDPAWTAAQRHAMPVKVTPTSCSIHRTLALSVTAEHNLQSSTYSGFTNCDVLGLPSVV